MAKAIRVKIAPTTGDPIKPEVQETAIYSPNRPKIDLDFDVRDKLAELVGRGNTINPDDKVSIYGRLASILGEGKAKKVMDHAYIFNQRPDIQKLPLDQKLNAFYQIGSTDPDVSNVIHRSKSLGYGPLQGFRESASETNQQLSGRVPLVTGTGEAAPEIKKKVMVKIAK